MSILTTVAGCGANLSGAVSMSSNERRMSSFFRRMASRSKDQTAMIETRVKRRTRHAAVNARQKDWPALACWAGGGRGEASRLRELTGAGLLHANPAAVVSPVFT